MESKNEFTSREVNEIKLLLQELEGPDRAAKKYVRQKLRNLGFRLSEFQKGLTVSDFEGLIVSGKITVSDGHNRTSVSAKIKEQCAQEYLDTYNKSCEYLETYSKSGKKMKKYKWELILLGIVLAICLIPDSKPVSKPQWEGPDLSKGFPLGFNPETREYRYRTYSTEINPNRRIIKDTKDKSVNIKKESDEIDIEDLIEYYTD